ncbi:hypothetical protein EDB80DRAFT_689736 [Ilyonectria destructans]|nr:hypothetical protein EDB80DRAFT_689736 [Ilyonectria destructans]
MSTSTKRQFNALITALSLALGFSVAKGLGEIVSMLRWWLLSRRYYSRRQVELILQAESVFHVIILSIKTRQKATHLFAIFWLFLVLGSQIGLALMGLCYSVEQADRNVLQITPGRIETPDMSTLRTAMTVKSNSTSRVAQEFTANSFGQISLAYITETLDQQPSPGDLWTAQDPLMFCGVRDCRYFFHEWAAATDNDDEEEEDRQRLVAITDRMAIASASCDSSLVSDLNGDQEHHISIISKSGKLADVFFPLPNGSNQTTFYTNTASTCGPGCTIVSAVEVSDTGTWYYNCTSRVSDVFNSTLPEHKIGKSLRSMAAGGIALQGYDVSEAHQDLNVQFQTYPSQSVFGIPLEGYASSMAMSIARFAIGVVAVSAEINPTQILHGTVPVQGDILVVEHWNYVIMILGLVVGLHLVFGLGSAVLASKVIIPSGGPLAIARVIQPMTMTGSSGGRWIYRCVYVPEEMCYDMSMEQQQPSPDPMLLAVPG